jgi:hypothetical protein
MTGWSAIPVTPAEDEAWDHLSKFTPGGPMSGGGEPGGVPDAHSAAPSSGHPIHGARGDEAGLDRRPGLPNLAPTSIRRDQGGDRPDESAGTFTARKGGDAPERRDLTTSPGSGSAPSRTPGGSRPTFPTAHSAPERSRSLRLLTGASVPLLAEAPDPLPPVAA